MADDFAPAGSSRTGGMPPVPVDISAGSLAIRPRRRFRSGTVLCIRRSTRHGREAKGKVVTRGKREDYIYSRAYELAATGLHLEPITIIAALVREGYPEASDVLASKLVRNDLRRVCARNWPGVDAEKTAGPAEPGQHTPRKRRKKPRPDDFT